MPFAPSTLSLMYRGVMQHYPDDHRYGSTTCGPAQESTSCSRACRDRRDATAPALAYAVAQLGPAARIGPTWPSRWRTTSTSRCTPCWKHAGDDARYARLGRRPHARAGSTWPAACQLADENLGRRPARFVTDEQLARLDRIRARPRSQRAAFTPGWDGHDTTQIPSVRSTSACETAIWPASPTRRSGTRTLSPASRARQGGAAARPGRRPPATAPRRRALLLLAGVYQELEDGFGIQTDGSLHVAIRTLMPGGLAGDDRLVVWLAQRRAAALQAVAPARPCPRAVGCTRPAGRPGRQPLRRPRLFCR